MHFPPTPNQMKVLRYIRGFQLAYGFSPTLAEIARGVGFYSKSGVHRVVRQLEERGLARHLPKRGRSIELLMHPVVPLAPDGAPLFAVPGFGEAA